ncbi:conserved hypothetical protein [Treponema primitia ZAS-2]|uniref:Uncharacterized protein n=1 Tax=Treponema primitia (strain ATCC BAA-887 / DSM 12427 / ZAS-2) TaxID=545694 RepID=F5YH12_TREPZ|nr:hypothetical protein [Treponema primitia]AEF84527.1 conserved hypothetical protein [Treponema primitia ZAS-2]
MATEKIPSIYDDRGTIGSSNELDQYGVWVKLEPQDMPSDLDFPFPSLAQDGEGDDGDISFDELPNSSLDDEFGLDEVGISFQEEQLPALDSQEHSPPRVENKAAASDLSTQLLMKIAEELSSIKGELSNLKNEISAIHNERPAGASTKTLDEDGGFFDEEDDDKIALTGDELNNIIHNADFIEEAGADANTNPNEDFGFSLASEPIDLSESEDLTPAGEGFFGLSEEDVPDLSEDFSSDAYSEEPEQPVNTPESAAEFSGDVVYDGLGRPLVKFSDSDTDESSEDPFGLSDGDTSDVSEDVSSQSAADDSAELIYDGLGRPLNKISDSGTENPAVEFSPEDLSELENSSPEDFEAKDTEDLKILREDGVEPMTPAPEDISYLEEEPLDGEQLDLRDAIIDEPDLSDGIKETPLEEPSLDNLSLIDLDNMDDIPAVEENLFEEVSFDDLSPDETSVNEDGSSRETNPGDDFSEISFDDIPDAIDESSLDLPDSDLNFDMISEDADLPIQENVQDNVITDDSFESISLFDETSDESSGEEPEIDDDLEQALPEGTKIVLDLPPLDLPLDEIDEFFKEEGLDDLNFSGPGSAENADAGDPTDNIDLLEDLDSLEITLEDEPLATESPAPENDTFVADIPKEASMEIPVPGGTGILSSIKTELRNVLVYMDKLLESLPEEKIEEFAQSEYFDTYKKLFVELGIS